MNREHTMKRGGPGGRAQGGARRGFTLIELLVVISIVGLLAGLVVHLSGRAARVSRESRVRAELNRLVTAIEAYKAATGSYPPDHVVQRVPQLVVNPVTNALFYELSGVLARPAGFETLNGGEMITGPVIQQFFGLEGFANASTEPREVRKFLEPRANEHGEISTVPDVEVLVVPVRWPLNDANPPTPVKGLNPWRYVASQPTNNPASFDLWAEYVDGNELRIIGNWSPEVIVKGRP